MVGDNMRKFYFIAGMIAAQLFIQNSAFAKPAKYPMALIWDNLAPKEDRIKLIANPIIKKDLQVAYYGYVESNCYGTDDYKKCLENPPKPPFEEVFDAISIATPDLNNDGRRDLILSMGPQTGLSGNGRCGIDEYWFYENIGNDYRNIGKTQFLRSEKFFLGAPKKMGEFRDIITKEFDGFCSGTEKPQFNHSKYDIKKRAYFDLEIDAH